MQDPQPFYKIGVLGLAINGLLGTASLADAIEQGFRIGCAATGFVIGCLTIVSYFRKKRRDRRRRQQQSHNFWGQQRD